MGTDGRRQASSLRDLLAASLDQTLAKGTVQERAAAAWAQAAGPVGKRHTRGIFVKGGAEGEDPSLIVYVDAHALIYEFSTDALLYGERLAHAGFPVRGLEFRLSRTAALPATDAEAQGGTERAGASGTARPEGPSREQGERDGRDVRDAREHALAADEEAWAESLVEGLPAPLAKAALGAIQASLRTQKGGVTENGEQGF